MYFAILDINSVDFKVTDQALHSSNILGGKKRGGGYNGANASTTTALQESL